VKSEIAGTEANLSPDKPVASPRAGWMRPPSPPEHLIRGKFGGAPLERIRAWPRLPNREPDQLIVRCTATVLELRTQNLLPIGFWSFFFGFWMLPFCLFGMLPLQFVMLSDAVKNGPFWIAGVATLMGIVVVALLGFMVWTIYKIDIHGGAGYMLVVIDRKRRKVHWRTSKKVAKGEWNWNELYPYIETRNVGSRINMGLMLVEFDPKLQTAQSYINLQTLGMSPEPLLHTYSFLHEFMEAGVCNLPPFALSAHPRPGWYAMAPPWLLWLPRRVAKSIWAFIGLPLYWPIVVWSRLVGRVLPFNRWPDSFEAQIQADAAEATPAERQWLQQNLKPPESLPLLARIGFALAVVISAPVWWWIASSFYSSLWTKFLKF
jgi:hypothetical protein